MVVETFAIGFFLNTASNENVSKRFCMELNDMSGLLSIEQKEHGPSLKTALKNDKVIPAKS